MDILYGKRIRDISDSERINRNYRNQIKEQIMVIQVEISDKNKEQIINAISLLKGVKICKKPKRIFEEVKESKADRKAWIKAREDLAKGDVINLEELERKYL